MRGIFILLVVGFVAYVAFNNFNSKEEWRGLFESANHPAVQIGGVFDTKEECRNWMNSFARPDAYNLECGLNCEYPTTINGSWVCEETF